MWAANNFNDVRVCLLGEGIPNSAERVTTVGLEELQTECGGNGAVVMFGVTRRRADRRPTASTVS